MRTDIVAVLIDAASELQNGSQAATGLSDDAIHFHAMAASQNLGLVKSEKKKQMSAEPTGDCKPSSFRPSSDRIDVEIDDQTILCNVFEGASV
jgi:hypothetical protein